MAKYSVIADISKGILNLLRDKLVPEPVDKYESIGICEPKERGGYVVGLHPYDINEDTSGAQMEVRRLPDGGVQDPPAMIEMNYMISVSSKAELETKAMDEARIIGKIIQTFKDNATLPVRYMPDTADPNMAPVPISMRPLQMEEKVKVWTMFGETYKLSVFYIVGPIAIESEIIRKPRRRVETVMLNSSQELPKKIVQFETSIKEEDIDDEYTQNGDDEDGEDEDSEDEESEDEESEDEEGGDDDLGGDEEGGDDGLGGDEEGGDDGLGDEEDGDDGLGDEEDGDDGLGDDEDEDI